MAGRTSLLSLKAVSKLFTTTPCKGLPVSPLTEKHLLQSTCNAVRPLSSTGSARRQASHSSSTHFSNAHDSSFAVPLGLKRDTCNPLGLGNLFSSAGGSRNVALLTTTTTQYFAEQRRFYQAALKPRLICDGCYFVWRHGRKHVECSDHPRHKQMKRVAKRKMWKEDYLKGKWDKALDFHKVHYRQAERNTDRTVMQHNWSVTSIGKEL